MDSRFGDIIQTIKNSPGAVTIHIPAFELSSLVNHIEHAFTQEYIGAVNLNRRIVDAIVVSCDKCGDFGEDHKYQLLIMGRGGLADRLGPAVRTTSGGTGRGCPRCGGNIIHATFDKNRAFTGLKSTNASNSSCYIATACYSDSETAEVRFFRQYRDDVLAKTATGRLCIQYYYKYSIPLARMIASSSLARITTKYVLLKPLMCTLRALKKARREGK